MTRILACLAWAAVAVLLAACSSVPSAPGFTLTSDRGTAWSLAAQRGTPVVLFFGFTHCTDTCPLTLAKLVKASGANATVAFVTVDPQRDTPPVMHAYLQRFDGPHLVGLTGTFDQILAVENAYHVWAQRIPGKRGSDDYDEAHATAIFVIDRSGHIARVLDATDSVTTIQRALRAAS